MTGTYTHVTGVYKQLKSFIELKLTNQNIYNIQQDLPVEINIL